MGIAKDNIEVPTEVCWQEKELENYEIELKTVILRDDLFKPKGTLSQIRSIEWGEEHGLMLDKKGRLFGMGRTNQGLLGLEDREFDEIITNPRQITFNLPPAGSANKIIEIKTGRFHSVAVSRKGQLYSWGEGSQCRLGLGFIEEQQTTPTQYTPYQLENVFDSNKVMTVSCGEFMSGVSMQSGTVYTWGKGIHEKPKFNDYQEYSSPYVILEEKKVEHLAFGTSHCVALERGG